MAPLSPAATSPQISPKNGEYLGGKKSRGRKRWTKPQKKAIGRFLLAVLEWKEGAPLSPSTATSPQISSLGSEYLGGEIGVIDTEKAPA